VLHPELDGDGIIQFREASGGAVYSEDERPHYMDRIKRSMTFAKGDPRSPKFKKTIQIPEDEVGEQVAGEVGGTREDPDREEEKIDEREKRSEDSKR
jgi:hypothetical protein